MPLTDTFWEQIIAQILQQIKVLFPSQKSSQYKGAFILERKRRRLERIALVLVLFIYIEAKAISLGNWVATHSRATSLATFRCRSNINAALQYHILLLTLIFFFFFSLVVLPLQDQKEPYGLELVQLILGIHRVSESVILEFIKVMKHEH